MSPDFGNYTDPLLKNRMERIQRMMPVLARSYDMDFDYFPCLSGIKKNYKENKVGVKEVSEVIRNLIAENVSAAVADRDETIREQGATIREQGATIREQGATIRERDSTIQEQNSKIQEMSTENARLRAMLISVGIIP